MRKNINALVHYHFLYHAVSGRADIDTTKATRTELKGFLSRLAAFLAIDSIDEQQIIYDVHNNVRTGKIVGGISHAIFHYYLAEHTIHIDIYTSGTYAKELLIMFLNEFWKTQKHDFFYINQKSRNTRLVNHRKDAGHLFI